MIALTELLMLQEIGEVPNETVEIEVTQIHRGDTKPIVNVLCIIPW